MNNAVKNVLIFVAGGSIGSVVTFMLVKDKYAKLAQNEIDDVKRAYKARYEKAETSENEEESATEDTKSAETEDEDEDEGSVITYKRTLKDAGYVAGPYVISPDEYGEDESYSRVEYTYYADKVLADENDDPVDDVDNTVGYDSLYCFGEYEPDSVHIKNDALKCYIEILMDSRKYSEVIKTKPHHKED